MVLGDNIVNYGFDEFNLGTGGSNGSLNVIMETDDVRFVVTDGGKFIFDVDDDELIWDARDLSPGSPGSALGGNQSWFFLNLEDSGSINWPGISRNITSAGNMSGSWSMSGNLEIGGIVTAANFEGANSLKLLGSSATEFLVVAQYNNLTQQGGANKFELRLSSTFTGGSDTDYELEIDGTSPDTFKWRKDTGGGFGAYTTTVAVPLFFTTLDEGIKISFLDSGSDVFVIGDAYSFTAAANPTVIFNVDTQTPLVTIDQLSVTGATGLNGTLDMNSNSIIGVANITVDDNANISLPGGPEIDFSTAGDGLLTLRGDAVLVEEDLEVTHNLTVDTDVFEVNASTDVVGVNGITNLGDGGTTDYTRLSAAGSHTMHGMARVTKHVQGIVISGRGASAPTARTTEAPFLSWTFAVNDDSHMTLEVPKDMDITETAQIIAHWYTTDATADGVDSVNWQSMWNSRAVGETVNAGATTDTSGDVFCGAQFAIVETEIETIPANSITQDDHLGLDITRIALTAGTNPSPSATSIHLISVEIEYVANKLGKSVEINLLLLEDDTFFLLEDDTFMILEI
jgi:hypothetical protein